MTTVARAAARAADGFSRGARAAADVVVLNQLIGHGLVLSGAGRRAVLRAMRSRRYVGRRRQ